MARTNRNVVKVNIYLPEGVLEVMRRLAASRGCAYSELIREACRTYVLKEGPELIRESRNIQEMNDASS